MGVYIRGMEMPESCIECPFKWAADSMTYCLAQTPTMKTLMPVKLHEIRWKKFSNAVEKFRWKEASCPLVPVPPHGDLIDRNKLYEKTAEWEAQALHMVEVTMHDEDTTEWRKWSTVLTERSAFKFDVADAPTIIPAEEGET